MLEIRLLGAFELRYGKKPIDLPSRAAQSLFAYLVLNRGTPHRREKLAGMFWPDSPEDRARASLRHELWRIRKALTSAGAEDVLLADDITVAFAPASSYVLDVARFEKVPDDASADQLREALAVYGGELLPGFYEDWVVAEREHLQLLYEQRLERLLDLLEAEKRWPEMVDWAERWLSFGQNPDAAYRALMVAYGGIGDRAKLLATYERCVVALRTLGLEPSEENRALREAWRPASNLPAPLTSLIGREVELSEVAELLQHNHLVTLTGAGGVGKTRLAIEAARATSERFVDGVAYLEIAPLRDAAEVAERLRSLLRIRGAVSKGQSVTDLLCAYFRTRQALLVLDNCEHLLDACAQLAKSLLEAAPALHIFATSREALRVAGETAYRVPSLELPSSEDMADPAALAEIDSVRLFVERARASARTFAWNAQNARWIAEICIRLDGIPLALELAAARMNTLPLESMVEHLNDRFALLSGGLRTELPRHKTLRAMIDWSHELLSESERVLFRRLSVFAGSWTLEAAQKVAGEGVLRENDVLGLLPELVEKSLVVLDLSTGRYHMLETVREYALERLRQGSEEDVIRTRHLDYFIELAEASDLAAMHGEAATIQLSADRDNLISALTWAEHAESGVQKGLQLVAAARLAWLLIPDLDAGYRLSRRLLALPGAETRNIARCRALNTFAQMAYYTGRGTDPETLFASEESVAIAREVGDRRREAITLNICGNLVALAGNPARGLQLLEEGLKIARDLGLQRLAGKILGDTADILLATRDFAAAERLYDEAIAVQETGHAPHDLAINLLHAATLAIVREKLPSARQRLLEVIDLVLKAPRGLSDPGPGLQSCAAFLAARGEWRRAVVLFGAAERQCELANRALDWTDQLYSIPFVEKACQALDETEFHGAWAEGRRLPAKEAVTLAREWLAAIN